MYLGQSVILSVTCMSASQNVTFSRLKCDFLIILGPCCVLLCWLCRLEIVSFMIVLALNLEGVELITMLLHIVCCFSMFIYRHSFLSIVFCLVVLLVHG